jgi:hypothetical protein
VKNNAEEQQKIPIGRVRCPDQDVFGQIRQFSLHMPASHAQDQICQKTKNWTEKGGGKDGGFQWISPLL